MSTTREGVEADTKPFDAAEALLSQWKDAGMLSDQDDEGANSRRSSETEDDEEDNEDHSDEDAKENLKDQEDGSDDEDQDDDDASDEDDESDDEDEGDDDDDEDGKGDEPKLLENLDTKVKIKVDGEERTVSVKDLTRLYGQEASLTRKSQEVSELRKKTEDEGARYASASEALLKRALEKYAPYSKIDWVVAQSKLEPDELVALRNEARLAAEDVMFFKNQADEVFKASQEARQEQLMEAAKQCMEVLSNPETGIEGWSNKLYDDLRAYAVSQGMDQAVVDMMVDPVAFKIIDKARRLDQAATVAKTKTKKKTKASKKTLRSDKKSQKELGRRSDADSALRKLRETGSPEDAAAALMARWEEGGED